MKIEGRIYRMELKPLEFGVKGDDEKLYTLTIGGRMTSAQARQIYEAFRNRGAVYVEQLTPRGLEIEVEIKTDGTMS